DMHELVRLVSRVVNLMDAATLPANATFKGENEAQPDNISTDQLHN
ncbi:hypothetical protein Tco_0518773, partial [Tanacetum coccineum]